MRSAGKQTQLAPSWSAARGPAGPRCSAISRAAGGTVGPSSKAEWKRDQGGHLRWPRELRGLPAPGMPTQGWWHHPGGRTEIHCRALCTCLVSTTVSNALFVQSHKVTALQAS